MFRSCFEPRLSLIAVACLATCTLPVLAADPNPVESVVITAPKRVPVSPVPSTIESVTAAQIAESINTATTAGVLQYLPSVHVRERYIGDRNGVLVMRVNSSIASAQTTVYADGLLLSNFLNNSFSTAPRWGMVSPEEIDHVEVLYGPFSALYPGNSAGGVVRLITREPTRFEAHVRLEAFGERFREYGTDGHFNGNHASAALGNAAGAFSYWVSLDHLDNKSHPQTFGNTTVKSGAPAAAGTFTDVSGSTVYRDTDTAGNPRIIVSSTGIDHTVQDMAKFKLAYRFSPAIQASYQLGIWRNTSDGTVDSYLRNAAGDTVYNAGSTLGGAFKFVRINGTDYTVSAAVPSHSVSEHWMHGLTLKGDVGDDLSWEMVASLYDQKKDITRTAAPTSGLDSGLGPVRPGGQLTDAAGTGWQNLDLRGSWRLAAAGGQTLSFGLHQDRYTLATVTYGTSAAPITDWLLSTGGGVNTNSYGKTQAQAVYLQDEWHFARDWTLMVGGRQEHWKAFDGSNYNATVATNKQLNYAARSYSNFSPKVHLDHQLTPTLSLRASFGKGVRYPTVNEMFQTFVGLNNVRFNDPNLKPEQVNSLEVVAHQRFGDDSVRVSYFQEDKRDALISQTDTTVTPNISSIQNVDKLRTQGVELVGDAVNVGIRGLDLNGSMTYTHSLILRDARNSALEGTLQPRIPDWRATLVATWHASEALSYSLAYRYSGRQHAALFNTTTHRYNDPNPDVYGAVSHYRVFDAKVAYKLDKHWSGSVGINNLGNFKYYVNPNPYPQRTLFASLKYDY